MALCVWYQGNKKYVPLYDWQILTDGQISAFAMGSTDVEAQDAIEGRTRFIRPSVKRSKGE